MLQSSLIAAVLGVVFFAAWYWSFLRFNRRRGLRVLRWLQGAIAPQGQISGVTWLTPSLFRTRLGLSGDAFFRQPFLEVRLAPRQTPLRWALWRWSRRQETLTFQCNLSCPPGGNLEIGRTRWTGPTRRSASRSGEWSTYTVATLYISTQPAWSPQISGHMNGVVSNREFEFLAVSFHPCAPHFSATFSLQETLRHPSGDLAIFDSLREIAEGSPTSRM
jgi:hypothetical protein